MKCLFQLCVQAPVKTVAHVQRLIHACVDLVTLESRAKQVSGFRRCVKRNSNQKLPLKFPFRGEVDKIVDKSPWDTYSFLCTCFTTEF